jgi:fatty-acyl-CoA synthase
VRPPAARDERAGGPRRRVEQGRVAVEGRLPPPIDVEVMRRFTERFARWGFRPEAMTPVYGLAEAGLAVSFSDPAAPPPVVEFDRDTLAAGGRAAPGRGRRLVSVGRPVPGLEVVVRDPDGRAARDGEVGTVTVRGPSITRGDFNDPALSARTVRDGWLDTGDLGFLHDGRLYIAGRQKDLVIVRGRNYAPQEFKEPLAGVAGLRAGCVMAVGDVVEGRGEPLVILAERDPRVARPDEALESDIRQRLSEALSLAPGRVRLLAPGTLPRTAPDGRARPGGGDGAVVAGVGAPAAAPQALTADP